MFVERSGKTFKEFGKEFNVDDCMELLRHKSRHTYYEYLANNAITKLYLDKDICIQVTEDTNLPATKAQFMADVIAKLDEIKAVLSKIEPNIFYKVATRHGYKEGHEDDVCYKLSFRPYFSGVRFVFTEIPTFLRWIQQDHFWDMSVYSKERLLGAIGGFKDTHAKRQLKPESPQDDLKFYIAQHVEEHWPVADFSSAESHTHDYSLHDDDDDEHLHVDDDQHNHMQIAEVLANDASLLAFLNVTKLSFRTLTHNPEFNIAQFYIHKRCGVKCPIANRVHKSNNATLNVRAGGRLYYHCFDKDDCGHIQALDISHALSPDTLQFLAASYPPQPVQEHFQDDNNNSASSSIIANGDDDYIYDDDMMVQELKSTSPSPPPPPPSNTTTPAALGNKTCFQLQENNNNRTFGEEQYLWATDDKEQLNQKTTKKKSNSLSLQVMHVLLSKLKDTFDGKVGVDTFRVNKETLKNSKNQFVLRFHDTASGIHGTIFPDYSVQVNGGFGKLSKHLTPGLALKELGRIHKDIEQNTLFNYSRDHDTDTALLKGTGRQDDASITIMAPFSDDPRVRVKVYGKQSHVNTKDVKWLMEAIAKSAQEHAAKTYGLSLFQVNIVNPTFITNIQEDAGQHDFPIIRDKLLLYSSSNRLLKLDGYIYRPVHDCRCAYVQAETYAEFINLVLKGDEIYRSNPRRFDDAVKYLTNYNDDELPVMKPDMNLISFRNGVLLLCDITFVPYDDITDDHPLACRVARNHVDAIYTDSADTPLLDKVLDWQFDREVADVLCALFGRTLFKVGQLDKWQVLPYLVGVGGTGKSMLLNILQRFFKNGAVGNLAAKREMVFGTANLVDKEIVIGRDMPAALSQSLPQEIMQSMTAGEAMEIPRKGTSALNVTWTAPVVMASNHMPDYVNTGNNVGRRLVTLRFDNVVKSPQEDLEDLIMKHEIPNIINRCLQCYLSLRDKIKTNGSGFWNSMPDIILQWRSKLAAATNRLHAFFEMDEDERGCKIEYVPGHVTWTHDFKKVFENINGAGSFIPDAATFFAFGYEWSDRMENVCKSCKQLAKSRGGKCCDKYDNNNRGKKTVISNMKLVMLQGDVCNMLV